MQLGNTADLRNLLIETIKGVRNGSVDPKQAAAIGSLTGKIIMSARLDIEVMKLTDRADKIGKSHFAVKLLPGRVGAQ